MSVARYFILVVVKCDSVVSVARDFVLTVMKKNKVVSVVSEVKQYSEHSSEMKQHSGCSHRFDYNSSDSNTA